MKFLIVLAAICITVNAGEYCYNDAVESCDSSKPGPTKTICTAKYGGIEKVLPDLQAFANTHIMRSFEYLLTSTYFGNFEKNRVGFEKLFRGLSDSTWNDAIEIIKYIGKRGGTHSFLQRKIDPLTNPNEQSTYEVHEFPALTRALDVQKNLAADAFQIHETVTRKHVGVHDPEVANYIEEEFAEKHSDSIRKLAGHISDLNQMLQEKDNSLSLYLFDEYLQKA